jgi:biotin synthase
MQTAERDDLRRAAEAGTAVAPATARAVLDADGAEWPEVMAAASALRTRFFGNRVYLCSIFNARSGACGEDCAFCAQSARHATGIPEYELKDAGELRQAYAEAGRWPIRHFGVVTSGGTLDAQGVEQVCRAARDGSAGSVAWCASLGGLSVADMRALKAAGVCRFHHNIETAPSYFSNICTTHTFADRLHTLHAAREAGLEICSGGILGMGESRDQRVEFALTLAAERVESIPLNFLVPIAGTRLGHLPTLAPMEVLRIVAMVRLLNPRAEVKVCAGRVHLRELQPLVFYAGATGIMIGPLLTVAGRDEEQDIRMVRDLELAGEW